MKKSKKITRKIRFLAFILMLCLTIGAFPLYVFAESGELPEQIAETSENLTAFQLGIGEKFERETIIQNELYGDGDIIVNIDAALEVEYD